MGTDRKVEEVEDLRDELLSLAPGEPLHPRFHSEALIDLLLQDSEALQDEAPESAVFWAELASELAEVLRDKRFLRSDAKARAARLKGNVLRLEGDLEAAERAFAGGLIHLADDSPEQPFFCRALGLLRWAQDRLAEGISLLQHAAWLFDEHGLIGEDAVSVSLLGLLWSETSKPVRGLGALHHAALVGGTPDHPWLALHSGFLRATYLAELGACSEGRAVLERTMDFYSRTRDEAEILRAYRLEGAARARLGELGHGESLLEGLRRKQLQRRDLPEVALTSLTQGAVLASLGRAEEIERLAAEIRDAAFEPEEGVVFAVEALELYRATLEQGAHPWGGAARAGAEFLRLCRRFDVRLAPVPFSS
ncbi:MAG TPA: hypothetical protein VKM72_28390 [Thermoanaerobaculia bacterium]|nr:hypothetical protein [Thermoanaerobaculia bacterium]